MSAIEDITRAIQAAPRPKPDWQRVVLVGESALRALIVDAVKNGYEGDPADGWFQRLLGFPLIETHEFKGWTIRDCDPAGKWHEVEVDFPPLQKPNESA